MRRTQYARLSAALAVAALAVTLTACSTPSTESTGENGFDADGCATSGSASESVKVSGDFGAEPNVEFAKDLTVENTERSVVIEGKGDAAELGSELSVDLVLYDVASSKELIPFSGDPQSLTLDEAALLSGIVDTLNCSKAGDRVVGVVPASRAFGAEGQADIGVDPDATLLFVVDVVEIVPPVTPSEWTDGVPTVTRDAAGIPVVTLPDGARPTELQLAVLEEGDGDVVERGDSVTVHYQGTSWDTDESSTRASAETRRPSRPTA